MAEFLSLTQLILQKFDSLDNFNEISESNIPIYTMSATAIKKFIKKRSENKELKNNSGTIERIKEDSKCVDLIINTQNAICILFDYTAKSYVDRNIDGNGKNVMKVVDADLYGDFVAFPYEDGSPVMEKFDKTMQEIAESGLAKHLKYLETNPKIIKTKIEEFQDPFLKYRISIVFIVGCILSILSFCFEIIIFKYCD